MPSTGMARTTLPARSKKTAKGLGPSGIGVRTTVGAGGLALDLEFAAELAGAAAGAAGAEVAPSAFSFSVTELLMASTSALNCSCVMPGGSGAGAWAPAVAIVAHTRPIARMIERSADIGFPLNGRAAPAMPCRL